MNSQAKESRKWCSLWTSFVIVGLINIPALNQQEQDGVRKPVRYGTKKPKKQQQQQQQEQDQEETVQAEAEDIGKENNFVFEIYFKRAVVQFWR